MNGAHGVYEITIRSDGRDDNQTDRLSDLLSHWAQEENLSVRINVQHTALQTLICENGQYTLDVNELRYVSSEGHYCLLHMTHGMRRLRIPFRAVVSALQNRSDEQGQFLLINRGILVNQLHITGHTRDSFLLDDGTALLISRRIRFRILSAYDNPLH